MFSGGGGRSASAPRPSGGGKEKQPSLDATGRERPLLSVPTGTVTWPRGPRSRDCVPLGACPRPMAASSKIRRDVPGLRGPAPTCGRGPSARPAPLPTWPPPAPPHARMPHRSLLPGATGCAPPRSTRVSLGSASTAWRIIACSVHPYHLQENWYLTKKMFALLRIKLQD